MTTPVPTPLTLSRLGGLPVRRVQNRADTLNILIYGDSGTGKTTLAGSADAVAALRPVLVIDAEGGTESLVRTYPAVEHVRVASWRELLQVYDELHRGTHGYRTVVLDSLTELQKYDIEAIMAEVAKDPDRANQDPDVPAQREWGKTLEHMRRITRGFRDLPMNAIFTALSKKDRDMQTGKIEIMPALSGKFASEVSGLLDIVAYYYVKAVKNSEGQDTMVRCLLTKKTEKQVAKDRTGSLDVVVQEPTMQMLYDQIKSTAPKKDADTVIYPDTNTQPTESETAA